jgi:hypothetical protein
VFAARSCRSRCEAASRCGPTSASRTAAGVVAGSRVSGFATEPRHCLCGIRRMGGNMAEDQIRRSQGVARQSDKTVERTHQLDLQDDAESRQGAGGEVAGWRERRRLRRSERQAPGHEDGTSRNELVRLLKFAYHFLQREQARRAWFIFVTCVAFASIPWTAHLHGLRQGAIVLASLAAAAIFMPDLNSRLWHLSVSEIRDMIPQHRRREFYAQLMRADCPDEEWAHQWADLAWRQGVMPLLDAAQDTRRIHWDVWYEVSVHLDHIFSVAGRMLPMALVEPVTSTDACFRISTATISGSVS